MTAPVVTAAIHRVDSAVGVPAMRTMDDVLEESVSLRSFQTMLVAAFGGAAIVLAALGVYGVLAYAVSQRTREIGIRMALGARQKGVLWLVGRQALQLMSVGLAIGLPVAFGTGDAFRSLLYGVQPHDVRTFAAVVFAMAVVTLLAALVPAVRASGVNPTVALRGD